MIMVPPRIDQATIDETRYFARCCPLYGAVPLQVRIQRKHRSPYATERELAVVRCAHANPSAFHDLARDLTQISAPMDAALDRDKRLARWIDTQHLQHLLGCRLYVAAEQDDLHLASIQHDSAAHKYLQSGRQPAFQPEAAG